MIFCSASDRVSDLIPESSSRDAIFPRLLKKSNAMRHPWRKLLNAATAVPGGDAAPGTGGAGVLPSGGAAGEPPARPLPAELCGGVRGLCGGMTFSVLDVDTLDAELLREMDSSFPDCPQPAPIRRRPTASTQQQTAPTSTNKRPAPTMNLPQMATSKSSKTTNTSPARGPAPNKGRSYTTAPTSSFLHNCPTQLLPTEEDHSMTLLPSGFRCAFKRVVANNAAQLSTFSQELSHLKKLADSPHVVDMYDYEIIESSSTSNGDGDGTRSGGDKRTVATSGKGPAGEIRILMELAQQDLASFLEARLTPNIGLSITSEEVVALVEQMIAAVADAHEADIMHCDLKPQNFVLVSEERLRPEAAELRAMLVETNCSALFGVRVKLCDFGVAHHLVDFSHVSVEHGWGTVKYMSPEMVGSFSLKWYGATM